MKLAALVAVSILAAGARAQDATPADQEEASSDEAPAPAAEPPAPTDEDTTDLQSLLDESVVTTASRGAERVGAAPANVFTITAREIRMYGIRTLDEALEYLGVNIYVQRPRNYDTAIDVGAQGLMDTDGGRRILVLLDGHVMNSQDTGQATIHEALGVPIEAIDHIEVMLGAGSVIYGSSAMSAVIGIFTREVGEHARVDFVAQIGGAPPQDASGGYANIDSVGARVGLRYRLGMGAEVPFRLFGAAAALSIRAEWLQEISNSYGLPFLPPDGQELRPGETMWGGNAIHDMDAPSIVASMRVGDFRLAFQGNYYFRNIPTTGRFSDPLAREERAAARVDLSHSTLLIPEVRLASRLYADITHWGERTTWTSPFYCFPGQIDGCVFQRSSRGRWAGLEQVLTVDWLLDGQFETTFGYDVRMRHTSARPADSYDIETGAAPLTEALPYIDRLTALGGIFAQQVFRPTNWLTLNAGARLDIDSQFGARLSPRAAVVLTPIEGTTVRASYAEAFRAPTTYELYESDRTYRIGPGSLRPEIVRTADLEWRQRVSILEFSLRGFFAYYEDIISTRQATAMEVADAQARGELVSTADPSYIIRYDNVAHCEAWGGSLTASIRPVERLVIAGSFTLQEAWRTNPNDPTQPDVRVPVLPEYSGNARVSYELAPDGATLALAARYAGRRTALDDVGALVPLDVGEQLDLRATFTAPIDPVPGLSVRASFSYSLNPFMPYYLSVPYGDAPTAPLFFRTINSTMFGFAEVSYAISP